MKITCQACQAKYTIADEKVVGKVVKIRCKKCGATIVVNGNEATAGGGTLPPSLSGATDFATPPGAQNQWMVNVGEDDQRTLPEAEVISAFRSGIVNGETLCWKEGMTDWLPIHEVAALYAACTAPAKAGDASAAEDQEETKIQETGAGLAELAESAAKARATKAGSVDGKDGNGTHAGGPLAARRGRGRSPVADLFRGAAQAGGEDEVMTSAPAPGRAQPGEAKRAGAGRNENGLLLEGSSKSGGSALPPSMTATSEASGLIDIRQLGAQMRPTADDKKKSRVDDIMNLGGGGAFSPSLAAPVLTAPSLEQYSQPPPSLLSGPVATQAKSKALIFLSIGAGIFFLVAAVAIVVVLVRGKEAAPVAEREGTSSSAGGATTAAPSASGAASAAPSAAATAESPPPPSATAAASEAPAAKPPPFAAAPKEPKAGYVPAAKEPGAAPAVGGGEFNMGEARARLAAIAAGVQTCKRGDAVGGGKVEIVFAPSGGVQSATLMGGSPFDGTPTGKCVEARFRQARVPAFGGSPFPVTKSFSIN